VKKYYFFLAMGVWLIAVSTAAALDSIKTNSGSVLGNIRSTSPVKVEMERNGEIKDISVNQIETIFYGIEPASLRNAKISILGGRYEEALGAIGRINADEITQKQLREDIEYYTALAEAKLAISGSGKIAEAGRSMIAFTKKYPASYHYFQACETIGDLLVANRTFANAEEYYAKVAKAPWPDYQMRANVAMGRALYAQEKYPAALKVFDKVLADNNQDPLSQAQHQAAKIGKAAVLAALKQNDKAIELIETILPQTAADDTGTLARAYNILGTALRQEGKDQEALMAFLHVDLLYSSLPDAHAEALYNLAELWEKFRKPERALRARQVLEQQYKNSSWAKRGDNIPQNSPPSVPFDPLQ
jgi:tetratricopeptide (TPR) repeat protein